MCFKVNIVLHENVLYVEVTYHFNEQVDFKISSKLIQAGLKGLITAKVALIGVCVKWTCKHI